MAGSKMAAFFIFSILINLNLNWNLNQNQNQVEGRITLDERENGRQNNLEQFSLDLNHFLYDALIYEPSCAFHIVDMEKTQIYDFSILQFWPAVLKRTLEMGFQQVELQNQNQTAEKNITSDEFLYPDSDSFPKMDSRNRMARRRDIQCFVNIILLSTQIFQLRERDYEVYRYEDGKNKYKWYTSQAERAVELFQLYKYSGIARERFKMHIAFAEKAALRMWSPSEPIGSRFYDNRTFIKDISSYWTKETRAPLFYLFYETKNKNQNQSLNENGAKNGAIKMGVYFCPSCAQLNNFGYKFSCFSVGGSGFGTATKFPALLSTVDHSSSCFVTMTNFYKHLVFSRRLDVRIQIYTTFPLNDFWWDDTPENPKELFHGKFHTPADPSSKTAVKLERAVTFFLLSQLNITIHFPDPQFPYEDVESSGFSRGSAYLDQFFGELVTYLDYYHPSFEIGATKFKFITAYGVDQVKSGFEIYTTPFQTTLWISLVLFLALTSVILLVLLFCLVERGRERWRILIKKFPLLFSDTFFWMAKVLLEQCDTEVPPSTVQFHVISESEHGSNNNQGETVMENAGENKADAQEGKQKIWLLICRLILGFYLLMAVVILNAYRGIIKSEYALAYPFKTTWKRSDQVFDTITEDIAKRMNTSDQKWRKNSKLDLRPEIDNRFHIYYITEDYKCLDERPNIFSPTFLLGNSPLSNYFGIKVTEGTAPFFNDEFVSKFDRFREDCTDLCPDKSNVTFAQSGCTEIGACQKLAQLLLLAQNSHLTCPLGLTQQTKHWKIKPLVLFVPEDDFLLVWNIFQEEMENNSKSLKFSHNYKNTEDDKFKISKYLVISRGQDRHFPDLLPNVGKILFSSGIFKFWEEWHKIRFYYVEKRDKLRLSYTKFVERVNELVNTTTAISKGDDHFSVQLEMSHDKNEKYILELYDYDYVKVSRFGIRLEEEVPVFQPLAFPTSNVHLVFYSWLFCVLVSSGFLLLELVKSFHWRRQTAAFFLNLVKLGKSCVAKCSKMFV